MTFTRSERDKLGDDCEKEALNIALDYGWSAQSTGQIGGGVPYFYEPKIDGAQKTANLDLIISKKRWATVGLEVKFCTTYTSRHDGQPCYLLDVKRVDWLRRWSQTWENPALFVFKTRSPMVPDSAAFIACSVEKIDGNHSYYEPEMWKEAQSGKRYFSDANFSYSPDLFEPFETYLSDEIEIKTHPTFYKINEKNEQVLL